MLNTACGAAFGSQRGSVRRAELHFSFHEARRVVRSWFWGSTQLDTPCGAAFEAQCSSTRRGELSFRPNGAPHVVRIPPQLDCPANAALGLRASAFGAK